MAYCRATKCLYSAAYHTILENKSQKQLIKSVNNKTQFASPSKLIEKSRRRRNEPKPLRQGFI
ncbi:hypothetical protein [Methylomonas albis]|nr:hypothetical protein [Methylomonas albis]